MDPHDVPHKDVLTLTVTRLLDGCSAAMTCIYNQPGTGNSAVHTLIRHLQLPSFCPSVIQGDFNLHSHDWDPSVLQTPDLCMSLLNVLTLQSLSLVNDDGRPTWHHNHHSNRVLDLIFAHDSLLSFDNYAYDNIDSDRGPGDHSILRLSFGQRPSFVGKQIIVTNSDEEKTFIDDITWAIDNLLVNDNVDDAASAFHGHVALSWATNSTQKENRGNANPWWTADCQLFKEAFEFNRTEANRRLYRSATMKARSDFFAKKVDDMSRLNRPWEGIKWTKPRPPPAYSQIRHGGNLITSQAQLFDVMHEQFVRTDLAQTVDHGFLDQLPSLPLRQTPPFSPKELDDMLRSTNNSSAPGNDHVTWRHLKLALSDPMTLANLSSFFNRILDSGTWPDSFKQAVAVIIPKPKKDDYSAPKAYRPIALLVTIAKLFTKVLSHRLQFDGIHHDLFHPGQFGGIKKHATIDAGLILTDFVSKARQRGLYTSVLAVDIAQFFPSLNHDVANKILTKLGFDSKITNFISSFFQNRHTTYRWGDSTSKMFDVSLGTPQGDPISPVLSALYIAIILKNFFPWDYLEQDVNCLFYVDDGAFFTASPSMATNINRLTQTLHMLTDLFLKIGIHIEPAKLELMHFTAFDVSASQRKFLHKKQPSLFFYNTEVRPLEIWRYLGFFFDTFLSFVHHTKYYTNKAFSSIRACNMLGNSCRGLNPRNRRLAYRSCVLPILSYGMPLWYAANGSGTKRNLSLMARVQNFAVRWITGGFRTTPIGAMEILSGIPPLSISFNMQLTGLIARIHTLPDNHLLKSIWDTDAIHLRARGRHPRLRPRHLPDENPLKRLKNIPHHIGEQFDYFHPTSQPGLRVVDIHPDRLIYHNMSPPKRSSDDFHPWLMRYCTWLDDIAAKNLVLFTDGAFWKDLQCGAAAFSVQHNLICLAENAFLCHAASSFDSEIASLHSAIEWIATHAPQDAKEVYVFVDNIACATNLLNTAVKSSQMATVRINLLLHDFFASCSTNLHISYCPSHVGIKGNDHVDALASALRPVQRHEGILRQNFLCASQLQNTTLWRLKALSTPYKGRQWLNIKRNRHIYLPKIRAKKHSSFFFDLANNSMPEMTRVTYCMTGHAPTGEFNERFFPDKPTICNHCQVFHSREHILTNCNYVSSFRSLPYWLRHNHNNKMLKCFIANNPDAFSFVDLPLDIP